MSDVGVLGSPRRAAVDARGAVTLPRGFRCGWLVGADDRWHDPAVDVAVRQRRLTPAPAFETAMRVPSGDARQRVFGVGGPGDLVVLEVENDSPVPFVLGLALGGRRSRFDVVAGGVVRADGRPLVVAPRPPARWATAVSVATSGGATGEPLSGVDASELVVLWPVAHRTVFRLALALARDVPDDVLLARLPSADEVVAGWRAQLGRGMQVTVPGERLQADVDSARADALLASSSVARPDAALLVALEDWGFDAEAGAAWHRAGWRARRAARARRVGGGVLRDVCDRLVVDRGVGEIDVVVQLPDDWRGRSLDVRDAPTRSGLVSYSVRWHGEHPALLWEVREARGPVVLRAPGLDPAWSTTEHSGEVLLHRSVSRPGG